MIKFFRRIRQKTLTENRFVKYLTYAFGEIILVVIGILIALQINNWNENRKLQKVELKLLVDLKANLESTLDKFVSDTLFNHNTVKQVRVIQRYVNQDLPYDNNLDQAFGSIGHWASPYPILSAYKTLQVKGLDIISNESLRNDIIDLYEFQYPLLNVDYDRTEWNAAQSVIYPIIAKNIRRETSESGLIAKPNDFEQLKHNDEFLNILELIISNREFGQMRYKSVMMKVKNLISSINEELKVRNN